jgi:hypothetical protein
MIAPKIKKTKRIPNQFEQSSYFAVEFTDKSKIDESMADWSDMAEEQIVKYGDRIKTVRLCTYPVSKITIYHKGMETTIAVPKDCRAYQSIKAETVFKPDGSKIDRVLGRLVGIVKNNEVIEERFIDELQNNIIGFKL